MTLNPLGSRPPVEVAPRKRMTPARKRRIHGLAEGRCGCGCGEPVELTGPAVEYDHEIPWWMGGLDDWPNLRPWIKGHHRAEKTPRDIRTIAKTKRQQRMTQPKAKSKRPIKTRPKPWPKGRKLQGRSNWPKGRKIQTKGRR
jgi:hypothetical protein